MSSPVVNTAKSPLEAAQTIVSELANMTPENQLLAVKFATETLGLKFLVPSATAHVTTVHASQALATPALTGAEHSTNIRSFTEMKAPRSDQQFAAVVAYFYQFEAKEGERKEEIDADVVKEAARLAAWPQVQRWNMTLTNAKNAGYLDSAGTGKYKLSSVGENLVAITLPSGDAARKRKMGKNLKTVKRRTIKKKK